MEKVEIFTKYVSGKSDARTLMNNVNGWLAENPDIEIVERKQTASERYLTISIFYKEKKDLKLG